MNLFQALALVVVGALLLVTLVAIQRRWVSGREGVVWALVWIAAAVAIIWPNVTTLIAKKLGIHRGADLLLYCAVVVMLIGFLMVYVRLRRIRHDMTILVRQIALRDAVVATPPPSNPNSDKKEGDPDSPSRAE